MTHKISTQAWLILIFALIVVLSQAINIIGITASKQRADEQSQRAARLEKRIDEINAANVSSTCRTDLSASAQSELLRGNADVLNALVAAAHRTLNEKDVQSLTDRANSQLAMAKRRDQTLALCPTPTLPTPTTEP